MSRQAERLAVEPAEAVALRRLPDLDLSRWRMALSGAEPVDPDTMHAFCEAGARHGFVAPLLQRVHRSFKQGNWIWRVWLQIIQPCRATYRFVVHRWIFIGARWGASAWNSASRSRPSSFIIVRSWVGLATPRVAENASAISSGENSRNACS